MKQYNERPSDLKNIGEDITGAARHRNDTYESPEKRKEREFKKRSTSDLKGLLSDYMLKFSLALSESTEAAKSCLLEYEMKKTIASCDLLSSFQGTTLTEMRALVVSSSGPEREILRKKYNSLNRVFTKIKYNIRPIELPKYFDTKTRETFTEMNGIKSSWSTESKAFDLSILASKTRAVQFGNSIPDSERVYVSENLAKSIDILNQYFNTDFQTLGFSFGARGKAGSIAHYQDSQKVLAFNRHWDGALIHELGHAIDYALNLASHDLPYSIRSKYRAKLNDNKIDNLKYYMSNKEIFARLFEKYCDSTIPELTSFMFFPFNPSVLPDLDVEAIEWMTSVLKPLLKGQ